MLEGVREAPTAARARAPGAEVTQWICMDCTAECDDARHAWVEAARITRPDGSDAWLVGPESDDPDSDDAFEGWLEHLAKEENEREKS
jgi:hypothetical protein